MRFNLFQQVFAVLKSFDFELLAGSDVILSANLGGNDDLAFGRDSGFHIGKIASYLGNVNLIRM